MTVLEKYNKAFTDTLELKDEELGDGCTVEALSQWDSVRHISLISALEDEFDIMLDAEDIIGFNSYATGKEILKKYQIEL